MPEGALTTPVLSYVGHPLLALAAVLSAMAGCASPPQAAQVDSADAARSGTAQAPSPTASIPAPPPVPNPKAASRHRAVADPKHPPSSTAQRPVLRGHGHDGAGCAS